MQQKIKRGICRAGVFGCVTAVLLCLTWLVGMYRRFGLEPLRQSDYIQSEAFGSCMREEISRLENDLSAYFNMPEESQSDMEEYFRKYGGVYWWGESGSGLRVSITVTYLDGSQKVLANADVRETWNQPKPVYYQCVLNTPPKTNVSGLSGTWFHVDPSGKSQVDVVVWMNDFEGNTFYRREKTEYEQFAGRSRLVVGAALFLTAGALFLVWGPMRRGEEGRSLMDRLYPEELGVLLAALVFFGIRAAASADLGRTALYAGFCLLPAGYALSAAGRKIRHSLKRTGEPAWMIPGVIRAGREIRYLAIVQAACFAAAGYLLRWRPEPDLAWAVYLILGFLSLRGIALLLGQERRMREINSRMVEQTVKAERLKVDLITNVSHDLKTPLTSIITYIRLLEKEGKLQGKAEEYLQVLSEKSLQLKRLTEDLLDAARITSGSEKAEPERLNFAEMVLQANGEFARALEEKNLELISHLEREEMYARIDGQKTWRILSNLYGNVCKYSLPGTRVYADLTEEGGMLCFCLKNISRDPLNLPAEELMERFVQGDSSRSGGGNGLGLAIASDLARLQGGELRLAISGDLFTAELRLPGETSRAEMDGRKEKCRIE